LVAGLLTRGARATLTMPRPGPVGAFFAQAQEWRYSFLVGLCASESSFTAGSTASDDGRCLSAHYNDGTVLGRRGKAVGLVASSLAALLSEFLPKSRIVRDRSVAMLSRSYAPISHAGSTSPNGAFSRD
jgi:hypothetical protein